MDELILHRADGTTSVCPLGQKPVIVGRGAAANLRIDDEFISRAHCEVSLRENGVVLKDLGSHNGTIVNGQRIQEAALATGSKIQLGETQLAFQISEKQVAGDQPRREISAVFRIAPAAPAQAPPSETVKIPLPQVAPAKA